MKKLILFFMLPFVFTGCASSKDYYPLNSVWNYSFDSTQYTLKYIGYNTDYISIEVTIENLDSDEKYPLYFWKNNDYFSYVKLDNTKYDIVRYGRYYGEIEYTENKFVLNCYLSDKGKKKNLDKIKLTMSNPVNTLLPIPGKMFELHCIRIDLK